MARFDPTGDALLNLHLAASKRARAQLGLEDAQVREQLQARSAVPGVLAMIEENVQKQADKARKIQEAGQQQQGPPPNLIPPTVPTDGRTSGQTGREIFGGAAGMLAGGPQPAANGVQGAPVVNPGSTASGAPGSVVPIQQQLTGGQRAISGLGGLLGLIGRNPGAVVSGFGEAFGGERTIGLERLQSTDEMAQGLATVEDEARRTGDFTGLQAKLGEVQQKFPQQFDEIRARGASMARSQAVERRQGRAEIAMKLVPMFQSAGLSVEKTKAGTQAILEGRTEDAAAMLAEAPPGITDMDVRKLEYARLQMQVGNERLQQKYLTRALAEQESSNTEATLYEKGFGMRDPYQAGAGGVSIPGLGRIGGGSRGAGGAKILSPGEVSAGLSGALDAKTGAPIPGNEPGFRRAAEQSYYTDPQHRAFAAIPAVDTNMPFDATPGSVQEWFTGDELFQNYAVAKGSLLPEATADNLARTDQGAVPEPLKRYAAQARNGQPITAEQILQDPELEKYAGDVQRGAGAWFTQHGFPVTQREMANGKMALEVGDFDTINPSSDFARVNGHLNGFLANAKGLYARSVEVGGLHPLDVIAAQRAQEAASAGSKAYQFGGELRQVLTKGAQVVPTPSQLGEAGAKALQVPMDVVSGAMGVPAPQVGQLVDKAGAALAAAAEAGPGINRRKQAEAYSAALKQLPGESLAALKQAMDEEIAREHKDIFRIGPAQEEFFRRIERGRKK